MNEDFFAFHSFNNTQIYYKKFECILYFLIDFFILN